MQSLFFSTQADRVALARQRYFEEGEMPTGIVSEAVFQSGSRCLRQKQDPHAVSFPVLDSQGHGIAAITVPYAERIDQRQRKTIPEVQVALGIAARELTSRIGGRVSEPKRTVRPIQN